MQNWIAEVMGQSKLVIFITKTFRQFPDIITSRKQCRNSNKAFRVDWLGIDASAVDKAATARSRFAKASRRKQSCKNVQRRMQVCTLSIPFRSGSRELHFKMKSICKKYWLFRKRLEGACCDPLMQLCTCFEEQTHVLTPGGGAKVDTHGVLHFKCCHESLESNET